MQHLLSIALRQSLPDKVVRHLLEMSAFFRGICSTKLTQDEMDRLRGDVCITLCKLEQVFPPAFFTSMVYLVVHLVRECRLSEAVQYIYILIIRMYLVGQTENVLMCMCVLQEP
jgi:hypothetical protein